MNNSNELKYYNSSEIWKQEVSQKQIDMLECALNLIPKDVKSILDIGCGNGVITNNLPNEIDVCGLDISDEALKYVNRKKIVGSIDNIPFENEKYDMILTTDTLEHLPLDIYNKGFDEIKRVAKKYVLIVVPYKENLDYARTKCKFCGCTFHVNWHIHSLDIKKVLSSFQDSNFKLKKISFTGETWPYYFKEIDDIDRILSGNYPNWSEALCPTCGTVQGDKPSKESIDALNLLKNNYFKDNLNQTIYEIPTKNEMVLLFERQSEIKEFCKDDIYFYIKKEDESDKHNVKLVKKKVNDIIIGSRLYEKKYTEKFAIHPYLLVNEDVNWGDIELVDGKLVRKYINTKTKFNHAVFVIPQFTKESYKITMSYKDCSNNPLIVQVYDKKLSYFPIGELESKNDGQWKKILLDVPENINCLDEGFMFDMVSKNPDEDVCYYFEYIMIDNDIYKEQELICEEVFKEDGYYFLKYKINLQKVLQNCYHIKFANNFNGLKEVGLCNNNTFIVLDYEKIYNNLLEVKIYPWLISDEYLQDEFNLFKPYDENINRNHQNLIKYFQKNNINAEEEISKILLSNNKIQNYIENELIKVNQKLLSDTEFLKNQVIVQQNENMQKANAYINEIEKVNTILSAMEDKYTKLESKHIEDCSEYKSKIESLQSKILVLEEQKHQCEEKVNQYENEIQKLKQKKLLDYIFKKGE